MRFGHRFRPPTGFDEQSLASVRAWAEHRCQVPPRRLDWYVREDPAPNAFAAGRPSIAFTTGFLQLLEARRLSHDEAVAVAIHEIGHHATRATKYGLMVEWLSWPWRAAYRALTRLGAAMPYAGAGMLLMPVVFTVAIIQTAQLDAPPERLVPVLALLITLALGIFRVPGLRRRPRPGKRARRRPLHRPAGRRRRSGHRPTPRRAIPPKRSTHSPPPLPPHNRAEAAAAGRSRPTATSADGRLPSPRSGWGPEGPRGSRGAGRH